MLHLCKTRVFFFPTPYLQGETLMKNKEDLLCLNLLITFLTSSIDTTNSNPLIPTMSKYDDEI